MAELKVYDIYGQPVRVTDLPAAILKADEYRHYCHVDPTFRVLDRRLRAYWSDFYFKLVALSKKRV